MKTPNKLPNNYKPLDKLDICSNKLLNGVKLIEIDGFAPILIGDGLIPRIWIFGKNQNSKWIKLISESKSLNPAIQIINDKTSREIIIGIQNRIILKARMTYEKICEIDNLDLRPIGFDIHGQGNELYISDSSFSGNTFQNGGFLIKLDESQYVD